MLGFRRRCFSFSCRIKLPKLECAQKTIEENLSSLIANGQKRARPFPLERYQNLIQSKEPESVQLLEELFLALPNETAPEVPEEKNEIIGYFGREEHASLRFPQGINHVDVGNQMGLFNFESASAVVGSKWVYLKGEGALLENALIQFTLDKLVRRGFELIFPPDVADVKLVQACGFQPKDRDGEVYCLADSSLALAATSEILLAGMYAGKRIAKHLLPKRFVALSHCFRPEVGHYGSNARGLYRVHQFSKIEMFSFCLATQTDSIFQEFVALQREIIEDLQLYARLLEMSSKELGNSAYRKQDIEVWFPMRQQWGEVTSASNCTDFQTKRLGIYSIDSRTGEKLQVHTVNATALAVPRIIQAFIENFTSQDSEGKWKFNSLPCKLNPFFIGK